MSTIYLLRHAEREDNHAFNTNLTELGMYNSNHHIKQELMTLNLDNIYCSPFRRCLQTVLPYARETAKLIKVESALAENTPFPPEKMFMSYIDNNYQSVVPFTGKYGKSFSTIKEQLSEFLATIQHCETTQTCVLVTHLPVINAFYSILGHDNKFFTKQPLGEIQGPFYT
jgi:broad specificity phosphatase PhoE